MLVFSINVCSALRNVTGKKKGVYFKERSELALKKKKYIQTEGLWTGRDGHTLWFHCSKFFSSSNILPDKLGSLGLTQILDSSQSDTSRYVLLSFLKETEAFTNPQFES